MYLSFPQAKHVGNSSDSPLKKGDEGGLFKKNSGQAGMTEKR
jgi:hypothetical protein